VVAGVVDHAQTRLPCGFLVCPARKEQKGKVVAGVVDHAQTRLPCGFLAVQQEKKYKGGRKEGTEIEA
jgi:spore germination cell wall hydrolase CwlJ-like protein